MALRVRTTVRSNQAAINTLTRLSGMSVLVGIPSSSAGRPGSPLDNAQIGYLQEFGNPSTNLPARPFLIPGVIAALPRIRVVLELAARREVNGASGSMMAGMNAAGLLAVASVKRRIRSNIPPPLALRTIQNRLYRRRTYQNASPARKRAMMRNWLTLRFTALIDTSSLIGSITYVIRRRP